MTSIITNSGNDPDVSSGLVLADTFRNLVRYALRKIHRDSLRLGVTPDAFSLAAVDTSLSAPSNAGILGVAAAPSLELLLKNAYGPSLVFHFYWMAPVAPEPMEAVFALSHQPDGDLKVKLLWLALPERIPISPGAGPAGGLKPLEEAVAELLRVLPDGRLAPYPSPA